MTAGADPRAAARAPGTVTTTCAEAPSCSQARGAVSNSRPMRPLPTFALAAAAALLVLSSAVRVDAQTGAQSLALEKKLLAAKTLKCKFSTMATGDWVEGGKTKATVAPAKIEVAFSAIDIDGGTAEADGGYGGEFISVKYSHGYLHFMQISGAGPLYVTTVLVTETAPGRFKAVHTRHEWTPTSIPGFTSRPEMYVGECVAGA